MTSTSDEMWRCSGCNLRNSAKAKSCFACFDPNPNAPPSEPASKSEDVKAEESAPQSSHKTTEEPEQKAQQTEFKKDEATIELEEDYASREPHLKPIFFTMPLDTRPFGLALCKKFQEKYLCVVVPESKSGQQGVMVGTEVLAIDHFLLDSDNWKYVNKFWPGKGFYYMPMFDKVAYLRSKDNISETPIVLYCRYDPMHVLALGRTKSPDPDAEPCQWWDALLSDTYRWAVAQKPEVWNVVGDYPVEVINKLPLQVEPKKKTEASTDDTPLQSAKDEEQKPESNPAIPKKAMSPTIQSMQQKEESEKIDAALSGKGDLDAIKMLQSAHRSSLSGLKLEETTSNESQSKSQATATDSTSAVQSTSAALAGAGASGTSTWKPPKMVTRPSVRESTSASTDDSDFLSGGDEEDERGLSVVTEIQPGTQLKVFAKAGAYIQIREPFPGWIKYKESQSEVFVKMDETQSADDESKADDSKIIPKDLTQIGFGEPLKGDFKLKMANEYISRYDTAPNPITEEEEEDHDTDAATPPVDPEYWLSKLLKPDMVNVVYLMSDMNLGNAAAVQQTQMSTVKSLYDRFSDKAHFIIIRLCLLNNPDSPAAKTIPSVLESTQAVLCRGSIQILNSYGLNSFGADFFKGAFFVTDRTGKIVADPRSTLNEEFDADNSSEQKIAALIES